jgi:hypothetical protein
MVFGEYDLEWFLRRGPPYRQNRLQTEWASRAA